MRARFVAAVLGLSAGSAFAQPDPAPAPDPQPAPEPTPESQPEQPKPEQPPVPTIKVSGRVTDAFGKPVRGASVGVQGGDATTTTDAKGKYSLQAPVGATLVIDKKGFGTGIATVTGDNLDDVVMLTESQATETIEVKGEAPPETPGAAKLDREELQRVPGTGGDVVRALTVMPGVANFQLPIGYSGVVIRGSSPQDSKILVDDFEIPVLYHNIGFRAIVPAESIDKLDYLPGGFDVGYGRASSGVVSLTTRPGSDKRTTQAEVSLIDGGIVAQGPITDDSRYMIAVRRSTIDLVLPYIIPSSADLSLTTVPSYYDLQLRYDQKLSDHWRLAISSLGTDDTFELYATKDTDAATKRFYNETRFLRLTGQAKYADGPWSATLALSGILPEFIFEAGVYQHIDVKQSAITPRAEVVRTWTDAVGLKNVEWKAGAELQAGYAQLDLALPREVREGETMQSYDPKDTTETFKGSFWVPDLALWSSLGADFGERVHVTGGLRLDGFTRNDQYAPLPRGKVEVKLTKALTAKLTSGAYIRPPEYQSELLAKNLKGERSLQTITGLEWHPQEGLRVQTSLYYTERSDLITSMPDGSLGNDGRGKTYGAEFLGTYRGGPWFAWLSYSYSHSTRVDHPGAAERLFDFDQPHSLNAALSWKNERWTLSGRFELYSGLPYTPSTGGVLDSDRNVYIPIYAPVNSARAPLHHQLDLRVDYGWHAGPVAMTAFLDVQNVYMDESIAAYFDSYDYSQHAAFKSLPIIPSIGLRGVL